MYILPTQTYYTASGEQHSARQWFLLLVQPENDVNNIRAIVRKVALVQFGHWMMGYAKILNLSILVSGSYGSDGLPITVADKVFDIAIPLPDKLYNAWNSGGGWNSAGSEAPLMRQWALENFSLLAPKNAQLHS